MRECEGERKTVKLALLLTKSCRYTDNDTFARGKLRVQVDLVTGGSFDEVDVGDGITDFDHVDG